MAALFFDIDGTLLSEITGEIPGSTIKALQQAKENGHKIFVNTGRTICSIPSEVKRLEFDGYLCGCGTYLIYEEEVLFAHSIPYGRGCEIIDKMKECKVEGFLEGTEDIYFSERISRYDRVENTRNYMAGLGLGRETTMEKKDFRYDKILIYVDEQTDTETFFDFLDDLEVIDRRERIYECIQKGYSKATAIEYMREHLGLTRDQIYVFGDSSNDMAMFEYADHAVAMGVHDPVLEPQTEYITDTVEKDGIYKAMEHYGLI